MDTIPETHKRCRRCEVVKPRTEFSPRKEGRDGHAPYCRACQAANMRERRASDPEKAKVQYRAYYWRNREKCIAAAMRWQAANPEKAREINRRAVKALHARRPGYARAQSRRMYAKHREKHLALTRDWQARNPDRVKAAHRRYRQRWPQKIRHWEKLRRARRKGAEGSHTLAEWLAKVAAYKGRCHWCGEKVAGQVTKDHLIPLAKGGRDDIGNVVPSCLRCNTSKGAKLPHEFMGRLL